MEDKKQLDQLEQYRSFIGKDVNVDIACYSGAFLYPEQNILVEVTENHLVFKSYEINTPDNLWQFYHKNKDCSCKLSLAE